MKPGHAQPATMKVCPFWNLRRRSLATTKNVYAMALPVSPELTSFQGPVKIAEASHKPWALLLMWKEKRAITLLWDSCKFFMQQVFACLCYNISLSK